MKKNILIIGSGGREHALAWKIVQSPKAGKIFVAPGNGGTFEIAENIPIGVMEFGKLVNFAQEKKIDLAVVAPDEPLVSGLVDKFKNAGIQAWGPSKAAARIEGSKTFAKKFMEKQNVPTANFKTFNSFELALAYVREQNFPLVIKASGLAFGKGVVIAQNLAEAEDALEKIMLDKIFGQAGSEVVVEEFLVGQEVSFHAFCDGKNYAMLPSSQDHKPVFDGDKGPNTGGMGTIAPVPWVEEKLINKVKNEIVEPILKGLETEKSEFLGLLYPGLIVTPNGPKVLEFNARFGDPETQSYMRLLKTDLLDIMEASLAGKLDKINIEWQNGFACCIVLASRGYPGKYDAGFPVFGIEDANAISEVVVFHAGTKLENNQIVTSGGRVLSVTATGETLQEALNKAYSAVKLINFQGMYYRKDIGAKALT